MPPRRILPSLLNRFQDLLNRTTQTSGHSPTLQPRYTGLRNAMSVRIVMWTDLVRATPPGVRWPAHVLSSLRQSCGPGFPSVIRLNPNGPDRGTGADGGSVEAP